MAVTPFKYSPFFAFCFVPLGVLPPSNQFWLYGLGVVCVLRFIFLNWDSGQVVILMAVLVLGALASLSKGKNAWAGAFLAAATLIKYTPVIFLPYLIVRKQYKAVLWTLVFGAVWLLLPVLVVGFQKEMAYLASWIPSIMQTSLDQGSLTDGKNQSLISMVLRFCWNRS